MSDTTVTAALLIIGNEVLSGRTQDANLLHLARVLNEAGVQLREARVVPDVETEIIAAMNALRQRYDYLFTTGGIGPTHDDITAEAVARAMGRPLMENPEARRRLETHYRAAGLELTEARLRMARTPEDAILIDNPISSAPGFQVENVFVLAGVPKIMQAMLDHIKSRLRGGQRVLSHTVSCNLGEGIIAAGLGEIQRRYPQVDIGSYPRFGASGSFRVAVVLRHTDTDLLTTAAHEVATLIQHLGGEVEQITVDA